ncbi:MAG TPA: hypothetical protein VGQ29_07840 [Gemmatimonadales bacterium]|nr:hypothetical protein [Gemmatimonadales bacterium]
MPGTAAPQSLDQALGFELQYRRRTIAVRLVQELVGEAERRRSVVGGREAAQRRSQRALR